MFSPSRRPALAASTLLAALIALLPSACTRAVGPPDAASGGVTTGVGTAPGPPAPTDVPTEVPPEAWAAERERAVTGLLRVRAETVQRGDRAQWLAPLAGASDDTLRAGQSAVFDRMSAMGVGAVRLVAARETTAPVPAAPGAEVEWDVRASLTYRLRGFDSKPRSFDLDLTFKAGPAAPTRLVLTASAPSGRPQPWDLPGLVVRRSTNALVLAVGTRTRVDEVARRARTAAARVAAVWGSARPAVWVAPATDADAARLLGRATADLGGVAAATDGPLTPGERAGADRIVLVPGAWTALRPAGRDVVMTHELTHVTVRSATTRAVPVWLSEGFAELVAYASIHLPESAIVAPALERVRAGGLPHALPADADFEPGTRTLPAAYGLSLLALRTLADAHGTHAVVRLYRAAAGGLDVPTSRLDDREAAVDAALRQQVGSTRADLVADWRQRIRALLR
ncbi:hypothetical protein [Terrabacter sp. MAHUQ-38]|uniref:hypothetical protein n=1 Tax=unclassified Terrabacter TaxID=2630222 RepID=UPI00165DEA2C|nr:hypothetical protein [Terrabacter sp. MAHUQ-38]MBC9823644.1 hypothetical protein [Terrabacter sp. MAHUQ-38]